MAASSVQGTWKHFRIPPAEGSPESSLTWCLDHIYKPAPSGAEHPGHESKGRDMDKRSRVSQWKALVAIRTQHIKGDKAGIARFRSQGGLRPLLDLIKQPQCSKKTLDVALSILGNCCTELETRVEVRKLDGISIVVDVLKRNVALESVQNRAARALGNLAMDPESSALIHSAGGVPLLLLCVSLSSAPSSPTAAPPKENCPKLECAQSAARALLYLSDTHSNRLSLLTQGTLSALAPLIAPQYPQALRRAALRTVHELTRSCSVECAREVSRSGVAAKLGVMVSAESGKPFEELALKTLANMCSQGCLRPLVGSLGVIKKFSQEVKKDPLKAGVFLKALCLCCKEAVNRAKVKESGGLEALVGFMSAHQSHPLARLPLMACVDFVFDESAMEQLQELGLVPLLVARLVELTGGDGQAAEKMDVSLSSSTTPVELLSSPCFDSFDFPTLESCKKGEAGKEQGSSSFLSLRSWLVAEGLISSEGDLLDSSGVEGEWGALYMPPPSAPQTPVYSYSSTSVKNTSSASVRVSSTPKKSSHASSSLSRHPPPSARVSSHSRSGSSSSKTHVSPATCPSSHRRRPQASSAARLIKVTLDAPPSAPRPTPCHPYHPYHPEPWTPESPILLLLSRFSHAADPSAALITPGVMPGLLLYVTQHRDPSTRCIRMLCRLSCNPSCLQALVRTGSVGLFQRFLCQREPELPGRDRQTHWAKAKVKQLGAALLNNLRVQCESAFGAGVVAHVMLSGSEVDKMNCALCLPLIISNKPLLKKLLVDSGGLFLALQPLACAGEDDDDGEEHSADSRRLLARLFAAPHADVAAELPSLYFSLLAECLSALTASLKLELGRKRSGPPAVQSPAGKVLPPPSKKVRLADTCPYSAASFDLLLLLDDGSRIPASRDAVAGPDGGRGGGGGGGGSEYFKALLRGGFEEARGDAEREICIGDVSPGMLLPVLHYLHGCRLAEEAAAAGHCPLLDALALDGLSVCRAQQSAKDLSFQKTPLGEGMAGACRFLVDELQRELEELCVALLVSAAAAASDDRAKKTPCRMEQDGPESAEENLAIRTSALELTGSERQTEVSPEQAEKINGSPQQTESTTASPPETEQHAASAAPVSASASPVPKSESPGPAEPGKASSAAPGPFLQCGAGAAALSALLPQVYWFCQRYSFPSLRRACLAVLLGFRDSPRPLSSAAAGDCLRRLAREADCTDTLKQDLLALVSGALS
ncbi:armadillo repeat-containing protein 5 [Salarias fasciatus]|uniref:BTB domain-containing protein n=1 Tax=Salarias fasciatus TaxID=181472 RepID=A0A672GYT7_SALFA|nr:armadillo repeat-containing protein 5 [Salarias fasciatus]